MIIDHMIIYDHFCIHKMFFKVNLALWEAKKAVTVEQDAVRL